MALISAVEWVYENSQHTGNVRFVLVTLAIAYGENGACLSMKEIAERTKLAETTARRALESLALDGTIKIEKNAGKAVSGGVTNCYRILGFDTPGSPRATPPINEGVAPDDTPGIKNEGESLPPVAPIATPLPFDPNDETGTVEYVRAAGEKESVKEFKEFVVISQTDSLKPEDTRAQDAAPVLAAQTEDDTQASFNALEPETQSVALKAIARANTPATGHSRTPEPPVPLDPLPPDVETAYFARRGMPPLDKERALLVELVKLRGEKTVASQLRDCPKVDRYGDAIVNIAAWINTYSPGKQKVYEARSHSQTALPAPRTTVDPSDVFPWYHDKKIGAPA